MAGVITFIGRSGHVKERLTHVMAALRFLSVGLGRESRPFFEGAMKGRGFGIACGRGDRIDALMRLIQEIKRSLLANGFTQVMKVLALVPQLSAQRRWADAKIPSEGLEAFVHDVFIVHQGMTNAGAITIFFTEVGQGSLY